MSQFIKTNFVLIFTVFVTFFCSNSLAANGADCEKSWSEFKPIMDDFKSALACGSQYSFQECRENLALEGAVGVGAIAGAKTARKITLQTPKTCKISSHYNDSIYFELMLTRAYANCGSPLDNLKFRMLDEVETNAEIHRRDISNTLLDKLRKSDPEMDKLAKEAFENNISNRKDISTSERSKYVREFAEKLKSKTGISLKLDSHGGYSLDGTDQRKLEKFKLLLRNYMPESAARSVAYEDVVHYFFNSANRDYNDRDLGTINSQIEKYKESLRLKNEIKTGVIKTEQDVANALTRLKNNSHVAFRGRLATLFAKAEEVMPNRKELSKFASELSSGFKSFVGASENGARLSFLKKALGPALGAIFSGAVMAADCSTGTKQQCKDSMGETAESLLPIPISNTGCAERYSRFSPVDDKCRPDSTFNGNLKSFVMADPETQLEEFCSTNIRNNLKLVHDKLFPPFLKASCDGDKILLADDRTKSNSAFNFSGDTITSVTVNSDEEDYYGYQLSFDKTGATIDGTIYTSRFGRTRIPFKTKNANQIDKQNAILDNLSPRVAKAMIVRDCCRGRISGDDCKLVSSASSVRSGSSGAQK